MYEISFDTGGTFTDFVARNRMTGELYFHKRPSTPADPSRAVSLGIRHILNQLAVDQAEVVAIRHATTVAANAIIERKGGRTALVTTRGFRDVLIIGRTKRYDVYDLAQRKATPLIKRRDIYEIDERTFADGTIEVSVDDAKLRALSHVLKAKNYESVAICLLHAYANPRNEQDVADMLRKYLPGVPVSVSSDISPKAREYERTCTTVANAYVTPAVDSYVRKIKLDLSELAPKGQFHIMQSSGGLVSPSLAARYPVRLLESGPAAGVMLCRQCGIAEGYRNILTFDMGGTTAKVGAIDAGEVAITPTFEVDTNNSKPGSGLPLNISSVEMIEIGAGGGSIAADSQGMLAVGPTSAGAEPGPACYGRGGASPTVTDANVVLGYINPQYFNAGAATLDSESAANSIRKEVAEPLGIGLLQAAWGIHAIANSNMAAAMRAMSVERGRDPRKYCLMVIGGAGPLHACRLARMMNVPTVIVPRGAGVGSALGLLNAPLRLDAAMTRRLVLSGGIEDAKFAASVFEQLRERVRADLMNDAWRAEHSVRWQSVAYMRYEGQGYDVGVDISGLDFDPSFGARLMERFSAAFEKRYGMKSSGRRAEVTDWALAAVHDYELQSAGDLTVAPIDREIDEELTVRAMYIPELAPGMSQVSVVRRDAMRAGIRYQGPMIIEEDETSTLLLPGDIAYVGKSRSIVIEINAVGGADDKSS